MGVKKYILFLVCLLYTYSVFPYSIKDTLEFDGEQYIKHIVKSGESLVKISKTYNINPSDIIEANELAKRLYYNQVLYIPINQKNNKITSVIKRIEEKKYSKSFLDNNKSRINISLLLPLYALLNDTLISVSDNLNDSQDIIYPKSEIALSFFNGVELALDSLEKLGKKISLKVFDTENNLNTVQNIIDSKKIDDSDIIIGPLYSKNLNLVSDYYGNDPKKIIISPLSRNSKFIYKNPSVYQVNSPFMVQAEKITDFVLSEYKNIKMLVFASKEEFHYAKYIRELFRKKLRYIDTHMIESTDIDTLRSFLADNQCVIIPSYNQAFVSKMLSTIGRIDSSFIIFGLNNWKDFDNLDVENLMKLNVHFPDPYYFINLEKKQKEFSFIYENKYHELADKYAFIGYNIMMHFCLDDTIFDFKSKKESNGMINIYCPMFLFKDFSLSMRQ